MSEILRWDKPPQVQPYEEWAANQADSTPPGTYQPNMDDGWKLAWKAKMEGQRSSKLRVTIRRSTTGNHAATVQMKLVVFEDSSVLMSMNGTAGLERVEWWQMNTAVSEAISAMQLWRAQQAGEPLSLKYAKIATAAGASGDAAT